MITYAIGGVRDIDEDQLYQGWQTPVCADPGGASGGLWRIAVARTSQPEASGAGHRDR